MSVKPPDGTLPAAWAEGTIALTWALICIIQERAHVTVLTTDWLILDLWSLPNKRAINATLSDAWKVGSHQ